MWGSQPETILEDIRALQVKSDRLEQIDFFFFFFFFVDGFKAPVDFTANVVDDFKSNTGEMSHSIHKLEKDILELQRAKLDMGARIEQNLERIVKQDHLARKKNLIFEWVPESDNENLII